ncbi:hypothetical protein BN14_11229 [Rhizoctonia solani AG-1 IB]|uniref:Uncharacterized protein n=1 Tax=Thanatephorus cucumeris (strain AG1-IB / isolate 7/3/14) TaxID=1108050 RepID=M5CAR6_THACB|nr:hypothetical protein BN14_11229 [Rhizoctonia solani AG-1 IB]
MGATDGYTTKTTERLHKYLVKNPYRMTSGAQDVTEQMVYRLQQEEGWDIARSRLEREGVIPKLTLSGRVGDKGDFEDTEEAIEDSQVSPRLSIVDRVGVGGDKRVKVKERVEQITQPSPRLVIAKRPTTKGCRITNVAIDHDAPGLWEAIQSYVNTIDPDLTFQLSPTMTIGVWSYVKLMHNPLPFAPLVGSLTDFVRAVPSKANKQGKESREAHYDTVLVEVTSSQQGIYSK